MRICPICGYTNLDDEGISMCCDAYREESNYDMEDDLDENQLQTKEK